MAETLTNENAADKINEFIANGLTQQTYPADRFSGRGIVIAAGVGASGRRLRG